MLKTKPKRSKRSWVLYVLPMIALALSAFATPEFKAASNLIEQTVNASSNTFTLKGTVPNELNVNHLLVYVNRYGQTEMPKPIDSIYVKDGKFEFSEEFDQPYSGMLRAVKKDGTLGEYFMEFFFVPGEVCKIDVKGLAAVNSIATGKLSDSSTIKPKRRHWLRKVKAIKNTSLFWLNIIASTKAKKALSCISACGWQTQI